MGLGGVGLLGVSETGLIVNLLPVIIIGLVFGLAMDYEVFLVSRMREDHVRHGEAQEAVVKGFAHSARVVTAAVLIMISVFSGFVLSESTMLQASGLSLAAAVFFDALVVRMTVVPALMALLGRTAWWLPGPLERVLPHIDIEGGPEQRVRHRRHDQQTLPTDPVGDDTGERSEQGEGQSRDGRHERDQSAWPAMPSK